MISTFHRETREFEFGYVWIQSASQPVGVGVIIFLIQDKRCPNCNYSRVKEWAMEDHFQIIWHSIPDYPEHTPL